MSHDETGSVTITCANCGDVARLYDGDEEMVRVCERCITGYLTAASAMFAPAWQPIGTAPKDGTAILAWDGDSLLVTVFDEYWYPAGVNYETLWEPTHWQPLPAPPKASA